MAAKAINSAGGGSGGVRAKAEAQSTAAPLVPTVAMAGGGGYSVKMTSPDALIRHDISDEDLTMLLSHDDRPFEKDMMWTSIGAIVGSIVPMVQALSNFFKGDGSFGGVDLASCLVFCVGLAVFVVMSLILYRRPRSTPAQDLADTIRKRTAKELS